MQTAYLSDPGGSLRRDVFLSFPGRERREECLLALLVKKYRAELLPVGQTQEHPFHPHSWLSLPPPPLDRSGGTPVKSPTPWGRRAGKRDGVWDLSVHSSTGIHNCHQALHRYILHPSLIQGCPYSQVLFYKVCRLKNRVAKENLSFHFPNLLKPLCDANQNIPLKSHAANKQLARVEEK